MNGIATIIIILVFVITGVCKLFKGMYIHDIEQQNESKRK